MFLGDISHEVFLRDYWQKKPLFIRQAFPNFDPIISADELAGMACETDTARIVLEKGGQHPWELLQGPFDEEIFANLPKSHWTLLVNDAEKLDPNLKSVIKPFRFLGDWKIDDLMISYATEEGSVGAHFDEYDVFLIQGAGKRRWQISSQPVNQDNFIPNIDLRIMREFTSEQEWVLEAGDLLYLPPHVAHYGVSLDNKCMTYSVGFHMPNREELLSSWVDEQILNDTNKQRFTDRRSSLNPNSAELNINDLKDLYHFAFNKKNTDEKEILWIGKHLSQSKNTVIEEESIQYYFQPEDLTNNLTLYKNPDIKFLYFQGSNQVHLFANGQHIACSKPLLPFIQYLCNSTGVISLVNTPITDNHQELIKLLTQLFQQGLITDIDNN